MANKVIRIGVAGLGMGTAHAAACLASNKVRLAAVADPDLEKRTKRLGHLAKGASTHGSRELTRVKVYDDYEAMVTSGDIDALLIALPNPLHAQASIFAMKHGVHVLCDKPPTNTAAEMKRVARVAAETGATYMFGRQQRFEAEKDAALREIAAGKLGKIYHVESTWMRYSGIPYRQGWGVNKKHGGGALLDIGIHKFDDAWYLMGCPQPVSVFASMHCAFAYTAEGMNLEVPYNADDATIAIIKFEDGASLLMKVTFALQTAGPGDVDADSMGPMGWQELNLHGEHGGLDLRHRWVIGQKKGKITTRPLRVTRGRKAYGLRAQVEELARAITTGTEPLNSAQQAVQLMQVLDAIKKSGETGRSAVIKPFDV